MRSSVLTFLECMRMLNICKCQSYHDDDVGKIALGLASFLPWVTVLSYLSTWAHLPEEG